MATPGGVGRGAVRKRLEAAPAYPFEWAEEGGGRKGRGEAGSLTALSVHLKMESNPSLARKKKGRISRVRALSRRKKLGSFLKCSSTETEKEKKGEKEGKKGVSFLLQV